MKLLKSKTNRLFVQPETAPQGQYVSLDWRSSLQEWRVQPSWALAADYYTNDADDALGTAHAILELKRKIDHQDTAPADCVCSYCVGHIG